MNLSPAMLIERQKANINAAMYVNPNILKIESELIELKHPDYAFQGAAELTQMFLNDYVKIYKKNVEKYIDIKIAKLKRGVKNEELFLNPPNTINALWNARQYADAIGAKYSTYICEAFNHLMERGYTNLPLPNQLYSSHTIEAVDEHWNNIDLGFQATTDPRFLVCNYNGEPAQDEYIRRQLVHIERRGPSRNKFVIGRFCFNDKTLEQSTITEVFGIDLGTVRSQTSFFDDHFDRTIDVSDFRRSCFGLPHVEDHLTQRCDDCLLKAECFQQREIVLSEVEKTMGTKDPIRDKKRMQDRERKRNQREREKNAVKSFQSEG